MSCSLTCLLLPAVTRPLSSSHRRHQTLRGGSASECTRYQAPLTSTPQASPAASAARVRGGRNNRSLQLQTKCQAQSHLSRDEARVVRREEEEEMVGRRTALAVGITAPSLSLALASGVWAQEEEDQQQPAAQRVFFDVTIDGAKAGRVVVEVAEDSLGGRRLAVLARGEENNSNFITYLRRIEVVDVSPGGEGFVTTAPLQRVQKINGSPIPNLPGDEAGMALREAVLAEKGQRKSAGVSGGAVWLRAFDDDYQEKTDIKQKLVVRDGKFTVDTESETPPPNGTEVTLCNGTGISLADTHSYAGRIVEGADIVKRISDLPTVPVNRKLQYGSNIGDIIAKRQNRTFEKITLKAGLQ